MAEELSKYGYIELGNEFRRATFAGLYEGPAALAWRTGTRAWGLLEERNSNLSREFVVLEVEGVVQGERNFSVEPAARPPEKGLLKSFLELEDTAEDALKWIKEHGALEEPCLLREDNVRIENLNAFRVHRLSFAWMLEAIKIVRRGERISRHTCNNWRAYRTVLGGLEYATLAFRKPVADFLADIREHYSSHPTRHLATPGALRQRQYSFTAPLFMSGHDFTFEGLMGGQITNALGERPLEEYLGEFCSRLLGFSIAANHVETRITDEWRVRLEPFDMYGFMALSLVRAYLRTLLPDEKLRRRCKHCGKEFKSKYGQKKYCDESCRYEAENDRKRAARAVFLES